VTVDTCQRLRFPAAEVPLQRNQKFPAGRFRQGNSLVPAGDPIRLIGSGLLLDLLQIIGQVADA
jgi:hypothetical protein